MAKYNVHYSFYLSDRIEVEANSQEEAEAKVEEMIENGEIGNLNEMTVGDSKIWID